MGTQEQFGDLKAFKSYVRMALDVSERTADCYASYVRGACRILNRNLSEIVCDEGSLLRAIQDLNVLDKRGMHISKYATGLRVYFRFHQACGKHVGENTIEDDIACGGGWPGELMKELNECELRARDKEAAFWHRIFDIVILILTIVPAILVSSPLAVAGGTKLFFSMAIGFASLGLSIPVLWRPIRLSHEIWEHGKKLCDGEASSMECNPTPVTMFERVCIWVAGSGIVLSIILLMSAIWEMLASK